MSQVFYDSAEVYNWHDGNKNNFKNNLRTIEAQIALKLKNNKPRPKFTASYKKACINLEKLKPFLPNSKAEVVNAAYDQLPLILKLPGS